MKKFSLFKNDGADIGFSTSCLICGVVTFSEFKEWLYIVIERSDDVPEYVFDILDLKDKFEYTLNTGRILGFHPGWGGTDDERKAIYGIGFRRFPDFKTDAYLKDDALQSLERNHHIEQRFREMFPFIDW